MTGRIEAEDFIGAKVAILAGDRVVALRRDDLPGLAWAGLWDLPGGAREGAETPEETAIRESGEETGLVLPPHRLVWRRAYRRAGRLGWFFGALWPELREADLRLGDEGQAIAVMPAAEFRSRADVIPHLAARLGEWLEA